MTPLKLLARDAEDLQVIGAVVQDAIAPVSEISYRAQDKTFLMAIQRFVWDRPSTPVEPCPERGAEPCYERVFCALSVRGVESVQYQGFNQEDPGFMLEVLTLQWHPEGFLDVLCAGDARLRLRLADWTLKLEDFGESWPTPCKPCHPT